MSSVVESRNLSFLPRQYNEPSHFIVHISDTHLIAGPGNLYDSTVNGDGSLKQLLSELEKSQSKPDAIIFTGDLADTGEAEAYEKLKEIVEPVAERMGTEVIWVMGNHDDRGNFRRLLLNEEPTYESIDRVYDLNGLRIISLDTSVLNHHYGKISDEQLEWLAKELETPAEFGTIIAMHHPPIPSVLDLAIVVELRDQHRLAEVIRGKDVRSIIAGHFHYSSNSTFAGVPVSVATSSCYTQDMNVLVGGTRGQAGGQGFNLVHVYDENILHTVVPMGNFPTVGRYVSPEETQEILNSLPHERSDDPK
jgi:Icc protein